MITHGPLAWPVTPACDYAAVGLDLPHIAACEQAAGEWLWNATAARLGLRTVTWRPERTPLPPGVSGCLDPVAGVGLVAPLTGQFGYAIATGFGVLSGLLRLPPPADSVTDVTFAGAPLPPTAYRLEGNTLRRLDGGTWPVAQDVTLPDGSAGTWSVTYIRGHDVPEGGRRAAGILACELMKRLTGDKTCKIPVNAVTVTRNGTTINIDKGALTGLTNIAEVDQWIRLVNPKGLQRPAAVYSPDTRSVR